MPIDTMNKFLVGARGDKIVIGAPTSALTQDDARLLAAYLVALTADGRDKFLEVLTAVENT